LKYILVNTFVLAVLLSATGCQPGLSSSSQIERFKKAGPITPEVDVDTLLKAKIHSGYYRVVESDILELEMPAALRVVSADMTKWFSPERGSRDVEPYSYRVSDAGTISLPIVGELEVSGMTLTEVEKAVVEAYYPKYVERLPSVVCAVKKYHTSNVTVVGGVTTPGLYRLQSDEMSLVALLMKAGGIIEKGASVINIRRAADISLEDQPDEGTFEMSDLSNSLESPTEAADANVPDSTELSNENTTTANNTGLAEKTDAVVLPVKDLNIPFSDLALNDGDIVEVIKLNPEVFTVIGPVGSSGVFPYPPDVEYNLAQALAFAGGPDLFLNPKFVTIYRQDSKGRIVTVTLSLDRKNYAKSTSIKIKPEDVISVEITAAVRTTMILEKMLDIRFGYELSNLD